MNERFQTTHWHMPRAVVFLAVLDHGSLSAAARALGVSKSVVSDHLGRLEAVCGARLLERNSRNQRLTELGRRFLPYARRMASAWVDGLAELQCAMDEPAGTLRVTASVLLEQDLIAPAVAAFLRRYPRASVEVVVTDRSLNLVEESVDVAVRVGHLADSALVVRKVGDTSDVVVAPASMAPDLADVRRPEQLLGLPWVVHAALSPRRSLHGPDGQEVLLHTRPRGRADTATALLALVRHGAGLALVPRMLAADDLRVGRLVRVLPGWHTSAVPIVALYPSRQHVPPKVSRFIETLRATWQAAP